MHFTYEALRRWTNLFIWNGKRLIDCTVLPHIQDAYVRITVVSVHPSPRFLVYTMGCVSEELRKCGTLLLKDTYTVSDPVDLVRWMQLSPRATDLFPLLDTFPVSAEPRVKVARDLLTKLS